MGELNELILLDNAQFIYELSLAELELKSLGVDFEITNGLREFRIFNKSEELKKIIKRRTAYFKTVQGEYTDYFHIIQKNRTRSVNQYLTHWIYPYKGKFHPQMVRALLNIIGLKEGDTVLDPFAGSGTTALEAQLLGINFIGLDISPLCIIQGKVKTESIYTLNEIEEIKKRVISKLEVNLSESKVNYYEMLDNLTHNDKVKNFYKLARLLAVSDNSRRNRNFKSSFVKNLNLMLYSIKDYAEVKEKLNLKLGDVKTKIGDARNLQLNSEEHGNTRNQKNKTRMDTAAVTDGHRKINTDGNRLESKIIDGIITSPPYSIALDYVQNDIHSFKDLGYDAVNMRNDFIGVRGSGKSKVELYNEDMKKSYNEIYRVLKPEGYAVIVIGNATYNGQEVKTVEFTIEYMEKLGFKLVHNIDKIIFGLYNVMKKENILIFKK